MCDVADPSARRTISFSVDINAATSPELSLLPTVGPVMAQRIVDFRETNGPFSSDADLLSVKGIGPKKFAAMAPYLIIAKPEARPRPATVNGSHSQTVDNTWRADHNRRDSDDAQP